MRLFGRLRLFGFGCESGNAGHEFVQEARHINADCHLHGLDWIVQTGFVTDGTSAGRAFHVDLHIDVKGGDEGRVRRADRAVRSRPSAGTWFRRP